MSAWTVLADGVRVRTSRCYEMNSLVMTRDGHALLVDPGVLPSELNDVAAAVQAEVPRLDRVALAFTHPHWDHVLGLPWFPGATTFAHAGFADLMERELDTLRRDANEWLAGQGEQLPHEFRPFTPMMSARGTTAVELGPFPLVTYDTPGHCSTHLALWFPETGVLAAGDLLSDIEIPMLDATPWVYRNSLKALHWMFEQEDVRVLVPGHGPVAHGRVAGYRRLLRDLDYLLHLEEAVGRAWKAGHSLEQARAELAAMEYLGKDAAYAMNDVHADNVRYTYEALAEGVENPSS
jgi:glyoxylase-like metal-dependent hydrolase (beta-lactamase superfamily II)